MAEKENKADRIGGLNVGAREPQVLHALHDMSISAQIKDSLRAGKTMLMQARLMKNHRRMKIRADMCMESA